MLSSVLCVIWLKPSGVQLQLTLAEQLTLRRSLVTGAQHHGKKVGRLILAE